MINKIKLTLLLDRLKSSGFNGPIHTSSLNGFYFADAKIESHIDQCMHIISNNLVGAQGFNKNLVLLKTISEWIERKAAVWNNSPSSHGYAAYPYFYNSRVAQLKARTHAQHEAVERFAWEYWWENPDVGHDISSLKNKTYLKIIRNISKFPIQKLLVIRPWINSQNKTVIIALVTRNNGVVFGGACDSNLSKAVDRAFGETVRHLIAFQLSFDSEKYPTTFYEKRLINLANSGGLKFNERLLMTGREKIYLPAKPIEDRIVDHEFKDIYAVHRYIIDKESYISSDFSKGYL